MTDTDIDTDTEQERPKSKSQIKREMEALRELGRQLVEVPDAKLATFPLSERLLDALRTAKTLKREALRRQLQHIGVLLREIDGEAVRVALAQLHRPHQDEVRAMHEIEGWRDALIEGDDGVLEELATRFADLDRQHLRQLARNAVKEREQNKPPKSARMLFRYLSELRVASGG